MPVWLRRFHIQKINQFIEEQNKANNNNPPPNKLHRPNIS